MTMTVPFIHSLSALPESFRFTPVDGFKKPIHGLAWEANPYTLEKLTDNWHRFEGIGLMTGPISGAMSLDMDGIGSDLSFEAITGHPVSDLPPTVGWSSGRPGRLGRVFTVPPHWWERITGGKSRSIDGAGKFELRGPGQQAVMVGKHPNDKLTIGAGEPDQKVAPGQGDGTGFYEWLPGQSPDQIQVAAAPEWLLEAWAEMCAPRRKTTEATGFKPKKSHEELLFDLKRVDYLQELFQPANEYSDYETWLHFGMELHSLSCDFGDPEKLYERWVEWCSDMLNFDEPECRLKWDSFSDKAGGRTFASFIQRAQKHPKYVAPPRPKPQGFGDESDKAQEIRDLFQDLYDLLKRDDPEEYAQVIQKRGQLLSRRLNREEIQRRLLLMVAKEHGLRIGEGGDVTPRHRGLHTPPTASGSYTPLVPGFTHKGKDTLLFGSSGAGKTLAALGLSYATATGHAPFLDMEHGTAPKDRGATLWIGSDGGEGAHAMVRDYSGKLNVPDKDTWFRNFTFWGADAETGEQPWGFHVAGIHRLCTRLEEGHPHGSNYALVVLDTLKSVLDFGDISYTTGPMGTVMRLMQAIAAKFEVAVIWIHHPSKSNAGKDQGISSSGGNSNIYEIPFAVHNLYKVERGGHPHVTRWVVEKYRGSAGRKFDYVLNESEGLFNLLPPETGTEAELYAELLANHSQGTSAVELANVMNVEKKTLYNRWLTPQKKQKLITSKNSRFYLTKAGGLKLAELMPEKAQEVEAITAKGGWEPGKPGKKS